MLIVSLLFDPHGAPPAPAIEAPAEAEGMLEVGEEVGFEGLALDHFPFSAGIPPAEEAGMIGKISTEIDHDFQDSKSQIDCVVM